MKPHPYETIPVSTKYITSENTVKRSEYRIWVAIPKVRHSYREVL